MINWYKKISSVQDDRQEQVEFIIDALEKAKEQSAIGADASIEIVNDLIKQLENKGEKRSLIPLPIKNKIVELMKNANDIKRDSPQRFCAMIDDIIVELS